MGMKHKKLKFMSKKDIDEQFHELMKIGQDLWFKSTQIYLKEHPEHLEYGRNGKPLITEDESVPQYIKDYVLAAIAWSNIWTTFRDHWNYFEDEH